MIGRVIKIVFNRYIYIIVTLSHHFRSYSMDDESAAVVTIHHCFGTQDDV
jgi:hypothetical protein